MVIEFGSGVLFGKPTAGNQPVNPTPYKFGVLQEANVDFKGDLKKLFGQYQFPVATARGKLEVTIKGKLAVFDMTMLNQLYFAQTLTPGYDLVVDPEIHVISAAAAVVSNIPVVFDWGVQDTLTGQQFTEVAAITAIGQYTVNVTTGTYSFSTGDNTRSVKISYTYFVNSGSTITLANQLMGYAPELTMFLYNRFRSKYLAVQLNDVTLGSVNIPTKLEDFWIMDFDGSANADASNNLGLLMADLF